MPPKKSSGDSKQKVNTKSAKVIEDKTFGLKNKKGAKQQKFIQIVSKQVQNKSNLPKSSLDQNAEREKKKELAAKQADELRDLFKPVTQTVAKGVDPKSVVCVYFKQGTCQKGDRCKFSHNLSVERKSEKKNLYEDTREEDTMANWDEAKLNEVVNKKHGEDNIKKKTTTEIVCKFFLEAVEKKTYGWFWACPNGDKCMYRHALPPGFVLKSEMKKTNNKKEELSMEMLVEKERASLGKTVTKVTLETFLAWKRRKLIEKKEEKVIAETKKRSNFKMGLHNGLSGRDLFTFNPELVIDDDDGADDGLDYRKNDDDTEQMAFKNINDNDFEATEIDGTGTVVADDRFSYMESILKQEKDVAMACGGGEPLVEDEEQKTKKKINDENDDDLTEEQHKQSLKKIISNNKGSDQKQNKKEVKGPNIEIDESLFNLDDLNDIEVELDNLEI